MGHRLGWLPGAQQVDSQQQIRKIILGLKPACALEQRNCLGKPCLLMELESLLQQSLKAVLTRRLSPSRNVHPTHEDDRDPYPGYDLLFPLRHGVTIEPERVYLQIARLVSTTNRKAFRLSESRMPSRLELHHDLGSSVGAGGRFIAIGWYYEVENSVGNRG